MINEYLQQLHEGYLFSDKDLSVNLDKFENKQIDKLLVFGPCGSGKSTIGKKLREKYKVPLLEIDRMFSGLGFKHDERDAVLPNGTQEEQLRAVRTRLIEVLSNNKRLIIEGAEWIGIYSEHKEYRPIILKQSMIILGLSAWKAGIRAGKRNMTRGKSWQEIPKMTGVNYRNLEKTLGMIRNDVKDIAVEYKND